FLDGDLRLGRADDASVQERQELRQMGGRYLGVFDLNARVVGQTAKLGDGPVGGRLGDRGPAGVEPGVLGQDCFVVVGKARRRREQGSVVLRQGILRDEPRLAFFRQLR